MIILSNYDVFNFENAIRGMRNPLDSWSKIDSKYENDKYILGENDLTLAKRLYKAGTDHRKYLRQVLVSVDIEAPLYWWKEYDTYKIATVANSTSTMHTIHKSEINSSLFSTDYLSDESKNILEKYLKSIENLRKKYLETKNKDIWNEIIQLLPSNFNQLRTCTLNYETLIGMYHSRKNHKLQEWRTFCEWILTLPQLEKIISE